MSRPVESSPAIALVVVHSAQPYKPTGLHSHCGLFRDSLLKCSSAPPSRPSSAARARRAQHAPGKQQGGAPALRDGCTSPAAAQADDEYSRRAVAGGSLRTNSGPTAHGAQRSATSSACWPALRWRTIWDRRALQRGWVVGSARVESACGQLQEGRTSSGETCLGCYLQGVLVRAPRSCQRRARVWRVSSPSTG